MVHRITIINGNPASGNRLADVAVNAVIRQLTADGFDVVSYALAQKNIRQCVGCWDCWWKTPGICRFSDDVAAILRDTINADLVVYCSPVIMGMYSALLKKLHDRTIPLVHPYIEFVQGECHHRKRYPTYPKMGVILEENDAAAEEIENIRFIFNRIALNLHSDVRFFYLLQDLNAKTLSNEIGRI